MFTRILRAATSPRNIASAGVLVLAASGIAYAAIGSGGITNNSLTGVDIKNNSIGTADIQNNSITEGDVRNGGLRGRDLRADSITGDQIDESTLGKVPSATKADTATSATTATTATTATSATNATNAATAAAATLADKAKGFTRFDPTFTSAFDAVDDATGRANAPFVTLVDGGTLKLQAKCFRNSTSDEVFGEVYLTTTKDASLSMNLDGGGTVNNTTFLYTDSSLTNSRVNSNSVSAADQVDLRGPIDNEFSTVAIDGTWLIGSSNIVVRNGTPAGAPSSFYGTEHSCAFFGAVTHSGNA